MNEILKAKVKKLLASSSFPWLWKRGYAPFKDLENKPFINHERKYIFIHIPKTAGTTIQEALKESMKISVVKYQLFKKFEGTPFKYHKHEPALEVKKIVGDKIWKTHFKFAFVRNPWDLMVSSYCWLLQKGKKVKNTYHLALEIEKFSNFREFICSNLGNTYINEIKARDLSHWLCDKNGNIMVDFVGKVENLESDLEYILNRLNLYHPDLKQLNQSQRTDYRQYYDDKTKKIVEKRFEWLISNFNYQF